MERIIKTLRFPKSLLKEIEAASYEKNMNFSEFVNSTVLGYLREIKFTEAVSENSGCWDVKKHSEQNKNVDKYIRKLRKGREI